MIETDNQLARLFFAHRGKAVDKWEQYLSIYARELAPYLAAGKPLRLLEIGVQNGGSLELWSQYLPADSEIIGVDIDPKVGELAFAGNVTAHVADATDPEAMLELLGGKTFDIIIDDGSHRSPDVITAFTTLYNRLAYGGKFIVEDMHASYWRSHDGGFRDGSSAIEFFKGLVDALNADHFDDEVPAETAEELRRYNRSLASISFYDSVIVIEKLAAPKEAGYRRMLSGLRGEVLDSFKLVTLLPAQRVATLIMSEPQKHHVDACFLDWFADVQGRMERLTRRLAGSDAELVAARAGAEAASQRDSRRISALESELAQARLQADGLRNELAECRNELAHSRDELAIMRQSRSWRMTAPLRKLVERVRG